MSDRSVLSSETLISRSARSVGATVTYKVVVAFSVGNPFFRSPGRSFSAPGLRSFQDRWSWWVPWEQLRVFATTRVADEQLCEALIENVHPHTAMGSTLPFSNIPNDWLCDRDRNGNLVGRDPMTIPLDVLTAGGHPQTHWRTGSPLARHAWGSRGGTRVMIASRPPVEPVSETAHRNSRDRV